MLLGRGIKTSSCCGPGRLSPVTVMLPVALLTRGILPSLWFLYMSLCLTVPFLMGHLLKPTFLLRGFFPPVPCTSLALHVSFSLQHVQRSLGKLPRRLTSSVRQQELMGGFTVDGKALKSKDHVSRCAYISQSWRVMVRRCGPLCRASAAP